MDLRPHPLIVRILHPIPILQSTKYEEIPLMVHTYEVLVDIRELADLTNNVFIRGTTRYEIDAESKQTAGGMARTQAKSDYPKGIEYEARVTRLLK